MSDITHVTDDGSVLPFDLVEPVAPATASDGADSQDESQGGALPVVQGDVQPIEGGYFITTPELTMSATDSTGADGIIDTVRATAQDGSTADLAFEVTRNGDQFMVTTADGSVMYTPEQAQQMFPDVFTLLDGVAVPIPTQTDDSSAGLPAVEDGTDGLPSVDDATDPSVDRSTDGGPDQATDYPPVSDDGQIVGDPTEYKSDWFDQGWDGACAPSAIAVIASAYTGHHFGLDEMVQEVNKLGLWQVNSDGAPRMSIDSVATVLDDLGIPATATTGDLASLEQRISAGDSVIVAVNGEQIWHSEGDTTQADHAVVVSAIDERNGVVYLSDSGIASGNVEQVPLDLFMQSWGTSGDAMVTCDESVDEWRSEQTDGGSAAQPEQGAPAADATPAAADAPLEASTGENAGSGFEEVGSFVTHSAWALLPMVLDLGRAAGTGSGR